MNKTTLRIILFLISLVAPVFSIVKSIQFDQECGGFLKQAADASSVELAERQLNLAINYIEKNNLTSGYTSILYKTEDENIGFWYENLKVCQKELAETKGNSTLENTNVLMKLRESLTDYSEKGTKLTIPEGIGRYPNNLWFMLANLVSFILFLYAIWPFIVFYMESKYDDDDEEDEDDD